MEKKYDIEYTTQDGLVYSFYPLTKAGEDVWNEMDSIEGMESGKVFSFQLQEVLYHLKKAGYSVRRMGNDVKVDYDEIYKEFLDSF